MKTIKVASTAAVLVLLLAVLIIGCGSDYTDFEHNAPDGSTITFNPDSITLSAVGDSWRSISIRVADSDDRPLNGIKVVISGGFADPYTPTHYYFFDASKTTPYTGLGFTGVTDAAGVYNFSILIPASNTTGTNIFTDSVEARSGAVFGSMDITKN
jgi:hypothetical protein